MSWRNFKTHQAETKAVKEALSKAGLKARVGHGTGTAWEWLNISPIGRWSKDQRRKALRIAKTVSGRHGDYDGRILIYY